MKFTGIYENSPVTLAGHHFELVTEFLTSTYSGKKIDWTVC